MKLDFLLMTDSAGTEVERSIFAHVEALAVKNRVRIVALNRAVCQANPHIFGGTRVKYLQGVRSDPSDAGASVLVPATWGGDFSAESDRALVAYFAKTSADIVVTATPALAALATEFAPAHVRVVHLAYGTRVAGAQGAAPLVSHGARLDLLVGVSGQSPQWWRTALGPAAPPTAVLPSIVETGFRPRSSLHNRIIVAVGDLVEESRFALLIKALKIANQIVPGWRLRIYGEGPLKIALRQAVWRAGLGGQVDIVPPTARMAAELSKAAIFALPSATESLPMVALEAAAAGLPAVAFNIPHGPSEIVSEHGGGLLVPNGEHVSFGVALAHLMSNEDARSAYSARALDASSGYASDLVAARWHDAYRDVLRHAPRRQLSHTPKERAVGAGEHADEIATAQARSGKWLDATLRAADNPNRHPQSVADELRGFLSARGLSVVEIENEGGVPRFALDDGARFDVIECVEQALSALELSCVAQRGDAPLHVEPWTSMDDRPATVGFATVFRVVGSRTAPAEADSIVDIDLWHRDSDGARFAPRANTVADWVDAQAWSEWALKGSSTPSGARAWSAMSSPVDVVYTWVDGSDREWDASRRAHVAADERWSGLDERHDAVSAVRFVSRDEIYFSVSSVKRHMPWVRNIFIVTAGQTHRGIAADFPDVTFVDHRDIFPDVAVLPVFNSRAIESCVHRIPGLAEQFIYFNDDVLVAKALAPDAFFQGNGAARFFPSDLKINYGVNSDAPHLQAASNNRSLILRDFGFEITRTMLHTPHPHLRSVLLELEQRYVEEFATTRSSKFRSPHDLSTLSSLAQYYGWATQRYVAGSLNYRFLRLTGGLLRYRMAQILQDVAVEVVALGEPHAQDTIHPDERAIVQEFLEILTGTAGSD